jgi:hypothetical protein
VERIHANNGPTVSSFGIGNDFSESTMRGISEHGSGHYIYMNEPSNIPKYVEKALNNLLGVIGIEATLKLRGLNGCVGTSLSLSLSLSSLYSRPLFISFFFQSRRSTITTIFSRALSCTIFARRTCVRLSLVSK